MRKRTLAFLLILSLIILSLPSAIIATYTPASSLSFTTGTTPFSATDFVAHLGTLTITATAGEPLYQPSLVNVQISNTFQFTGPVTWWSQGNPPVPVYQNQSTVFYFAAVTTELGVTSYRKLWGSGGTAPLTTTEGDLGVSVFEVRFYFLSDQAASIYKPGALYTMTSGTIGSFNVAVAPNDQGIYNQQSNNIYVSINGQTIPPGGGPPQDPPTVIPPGTPALPYGDPPDNATYGFSILEEQAFSLPDGYQASTTKIASAQLNLSDTLVGRTYGVDITFSKLPGSTSFALRPTGSPSVYAIPYQLKFLGQAVVKDVSMPWTPLSDGVNTQNIYITGISSVVAKAAPSGDYMDTIVVTITPID